jgi:hypothetical protein
MVLVAPASAAVLFDSSSGSLPSSQGWLYSESGGAATQGVANGLYTFDTSASAGIRAGNFRTDQLLDTTTGFTLGLSGLVVSAENHNNTDRAGFSLLFVGSDPTRALELAFWEDEVWVYNYDLVNDFTHGTGAALDTGVSRDYALQVQGPRFRLLADGIQRLKGPLADYTPAANPFNPNFSFPRLVYGSSNFLFFGDDTSRADATIALSHITFDVGPVPEPGVLATIALAGTCMLAGRTAGYRGRSTEYPRILAPNGFRA